MSKIVGKGRTRTPGAEPQRRIEQWFATRTGMAVAVVGGGVLSVGQTVSPGLLATVQRDIALVDNWSLDTPGLIAASAGAAAGGLPSPAAGVPTFQDSVYYLLNDMMGIGDKTPAQIFPGTNTVGELLGASGLDSSTILGSTSPNLMAMLGLDGIKLETVLDAFGLNSTKTVDQILDQVQLGNVTLDFLLTPLGIPSTQTTLGLAHRFSVAHLSLGDMLNRAGFSPNDTMGGLLNRMGLGGTALPGLMGAGSLIGNMTCPTSVSTSMTVDQFLQCLLLDGIKTGGSDAKGHNLPTEIHVNKNTTIEQLLTSQHFYDANSNHTSRIIGSWTLGEIMSQKPGSLSIPPGGTPFIWNTTTTVKDWVDHIHVNTGVTTDPMNANGVPTAPVLIYPYGTGAGSGSPVYEQSPPNDNGGAAVPPGSTSQLLPTLGSLNFGDVLKWINLDPNKSLADIITGLIWVGNHQLSTSTIGQVLDGLVVNPLAIGPIGSHVGDDTTIPQLLEGMFGTLTINDMLNLTPWTP